MSNAMHKIKKPPIKGRRLPMKAILKTNIIITQKGLSKQSFSEIPSGYVHIAYMALNSISLWNSQGLLAVDILYQIKKAPANAETRPLLP